MSKQEQQPPARTDPVPKRYDRPGHLDPSHAERLLELARAGRPAEDDEAFLRASAEEDDLASELGESTIANMTGGDAALIKQFEAEVDEDHGGPFVETSAGEELADEEAGGDPYDGPGEPTPRPIPKPDEPDWPDEPDDLDEEETRPITVRSWAGTYLLRATTLADWFTRRFRKSGGQSAP